MSDLIREVMSTQRRASELEVLDVVPVVARYSTNAGQSIANNTLTIVNFEDKTFDSRNAVAVGASWAFTAPVGGYYAVSASIIFASSTAWATGEVLLLDLYKNGALQSVLFYAENFPGDGVVSLLVQAQGSDLVYLAAGDTIDIRVQQNSAGTRPLSATTENNYVSIHKV